MTTPDPLSIRIANMISELVEEPVEPDTPLFDPAHPDSLGLDSLRALEISVGMARQFDLPADIFPRESFYSASTLADFVRARAPEQA